MSKNNFFDGKCYRVSFTFEEVWKLLFGKKKCKICSGKLNKLNSKETINQKLHKMDVGDFIYGKGYKVYVSSGDTYQMSSLLKPSFSLGFFIDGCMYRK